MTVAGDARINRDGHLGTYALHQLGKTVSSFADPAGNHLMNDSGRCPWSMSRQTKLDEQSVKSWGGGKWKAENRLGPCAA